MLSIHEKNSLCTTETRLIHACIGACIEYARWAHNRLITSIHACVGSCVDRSYFESGARIRSYLCAPLRLREYGKVRSENASRPHGFGRLDPETFTPFPKNPVIAKFFRQIGRADELGSGMRNMMKFSRAYGGADPELIEGDVFRIVIKVPESGAESGAQSGAQSQRILAALNNEQLSAAELADAMHLESKSGALKRAIKELLQHGSIAYTIPDKPTSRLQKYRLTEKGRALLSNAKPS